MKCKHTGKDIVSPLDTLNESEPSVGVQPHVISKAEDDFYLQRQISKQLIDRYGQTRVLVLFSRLYRSFLNTILLKAHSVLEQIVLGLEARRFQTRNGKKSKCH